MTATNNDKTDFTQVPNKIIFDNSLTISALKVVLFILSKPQGWKFTRKSIISETGISENIYPTAFKLACAYPLVKDRYDGNYRKIEKEFTQVPNRIIRDKRLKYSALRFALYSVYALSISDEWKFRNKDIENKLHIHRNSIFTAKRALIQCGYMKRSIRGDCEFVFMPTGESQATSKRNYSEKIDCDDIVSSFSNICGDKLKVPREVRPTHRTAIRARKKDLEKIGMSWEQFFRKVRCSSFLTGGGDRGWTATFDWILKSENFEKIIEGQYDNRKRKQWDKPGMNESYFSNPEVYKNQSEDWTRDW